tara:strand:- start:57 stop:275 length:219 start_codon:yes stop_codon:yes gene_type:complete
MAGVKTGKGGASITRKRMLGDEEVKPVLYVGEYGRYMAGYIGKSQDMVLDKSGKPVQFKRIGDLGTIIGKKR